MLRFLLRYSPDDTNRPDLEGWTPLHIAAQQGHQKVIKYLLERKVDVNIRTRHGFTLPMIAAYYGHLDVIMMLMNTGTGVDINLATHDGTTPVSIAVQQGFLKIVKVLQSKGGLSSKGRPRPSFSRPSRSTAVKVSESSRA